MPAAAASEAVGPIFASALTLTLSIVSIAWGSWAQADVILNQANTNLTGYGIGVANAEQIRLFEEDEFSEHKSLEEQQRIWPKGMPGGDSYAGTSCNGCGKANKITQRRGPTDWCVTLQQVVVGPHENPLRRRLQDVFEEYTNYSRWINTSCLSDSYYDEWWSTRCGPGNATFPGQLNTEAFRDACEEYKVVSRPLNESATAYSYVRPPACRSPACRPAPPFLPSARLAQEEYMAKTCDKWEAYCSTSRGAMSSVAGLQYTGIVFMTLAMIAFLLSLGVAGKENNRFKIITIVGFVVTLLAWIMLFCATVLFAQFNNTINDPRDTYVKMRVCRLRIILGRLVIPTPRPHTADLPLPSLYPRSLPPPLPPPFPAGLESPLASLAGLLAERVALLRRRHRDVRCRGDNGRRVDAAPEGNQSRLVGARPGHPQPVGLGAVELLDGLLCQHRGALLGDRHAQRRRACGRLVRLLALLRSRARSQA